MMISEYGAYFFGPPCRCHRLTESRHTYRHLLTTHLPVQLKPEELDRRVTATRDHDL